MRIKCSECGGTYDIDAKYIGQKVQCPDCKCEFEVENPNLTPCPDCFNKISKRAQSCPFCGALLNNAADYDEFSYLPKRENIEDEEEIMVCRPSALNYLWVIIGGICTLFVFIGIIILLAVWIEIYFTSYKITTMRIIVQRGLIAKKRNEIWIKDMRGANLAQGIWQRIIGVGNISIGTAATAGSEICMTGIANPQEIVDKINSLRYQ